MPELVDIRQERFCQLIVEGYSQIEAFEKAGYAKNKGNASMLRKRKEIQMRIQELASLREGNNRAAIDAFCVEHSVTKGTILEEILITSREAREMGKFKDALDGYKMLGKELYGLFDDSKEELAKLQEELKRRKVLENDLQQPLLGRTPEIEDFSRAFAQITFESDKEIEGKFIDVGELNGD